MQDDRGAGGELFIIFIFNWRITRRDLKKKIECLVKHVLKNPNLMCLEWHLCTGILYVIAEKKI